MCPSMVYSDSDEPAWACAVGKSEVLVDKFRMRMRFDSVTGAKVSGKGSCTARPAYDYACPSGQTCRQSRTKMPPFDCREELRAGKDIFRGCVVDDGTMRKVLVALGAGDKPKWQTEGVVDNFLGLVDAALLVRANGVITSYDPSNGAKLWERKTASRVMMTDGAKRIFYFADATIAAADAKTGREIRMADAAPAPQAGSAPVLGAGTPANGATAAARIPPKASGGLPAPPAKAPSAQGDASKTTPPAEPRPTAPFDRVAAAAALGRVDVQSCKAAGGPTGAGRARITFGPDGRAQSAVLDQGAYTGTAVGRCIEGKYRSATVPPFSGTPVSVGKSFVVR